MYYKNMETAIANGQFNAEEIEFIKLFWTPDFNENWLCVSKEVAIHWFGYKDKKNTMKKFYKNLVKDYEIDIDFKQNDKNYLITGECLKILLMSAQTTRGKIIRKIYIKIEKLVFTMLEIEKQNNLKLDSIARIKDYHAVATANNGKCIESSIDTTDKLPTLWQCAQKHTFSATYQSAYNYWYTQCLVCLDANTSDNYCKRICHIIKDFASAELVTKDIVKLNDVITFKCKHIPAGWNIVLKEFLLKCSWQCNNCKSESNID